MVPKLLAVLNSNTHCFRAVLFRMVPKLGLSAFEYGIGFRAVLFRMVPKPFSHVEWTV